MANTEFLFWTLSVQKMERIPILGHRRQMCWGVWKAVPKITYVVNYLFQLLSWDQLRKRVRSTSFGFLLCKVKYEGPGTVKAQPLILARRIMAGACGPVSPQGKSKPFTRI